MRYEIKGGSFPIVVCQLESGEKMITEKGSMVWMSPNMQMETRGGGLGKMFAKAFSGESMFQNIYTARGQGMITFGSSFPGQIKAIEIGPGREMILQKSAFLASESGVELSIHFKKSWAPDFLAAKASSCRNSPDGAWLSWRSTVSWWNTTWLRGSSWWWIPGMWLALLPASRWTFSRSPV